MSTPPTAPPVRLPPTGGEPPAETNFFGDPVDPYTGEPVDTGESTADGSTGEAPADTGEPPPCARCLGRGRARDRRRGSKAPARVDERRGALARHPTGLTVGLQTDTNRDGAPLRCIVTPELYPATHRRTLRSSTMQSCRRRCSRRRVVECQGWSHQVGGSAVPTRSIVCESPVASHRISPNVGSSCHCVH